MNSNRTLGRSETLEGQLEIQSFVPRKILQIFSCFIKVKEFSVGHLSSEGMHVEIFDIGRRLRLD